MVQDKAPIVSRIGGYERVLRFISPKRALEREQYQQALKIADKAREYNSAGRGRRTNGWLANGSGANSEIAKGGDLTNWRVRDLVRNNQYARRAVQAVSNNTIGSGIKPTPLELNSTTELNFREVWDAWADSRDCDFDGHLNLWGLQNLAMRCVAECGEVLIRRRFVNDKSLVLPLQVQVLEPDFLDRNKNTIIQPGKSYTVQGIEFNGAGKRTGYWMFDVHPGEDGGSGVSYFVAAEHVDHIFFKERAGQVRGMSMLASSVVSLYDFAEYEDAQLVRQKIAACFTIFISDPNLTGLPGEANGPASDADRLDKVGPGIIEYLGPNRTVDFANPPSVTNYAEYGTAVLRKVAAGIGVSYEVLSGDYSNVNFSSARMGWIEFHRNISNWQDMMIIPAFCSPVWKWFCQVMIIKGIVTKTVKVKWTPPRREMIDPVKETQALSLMIRNGIEPWSEIVKQMGGDPVKVLTQIAKDFNDMEAAGLILECNPASDAERMNMTEKIANQQATETNNKTNKQKKDNTKK